MSAGVTIREDGTVEMFSGQNIVPWHRGGTVVSGLVLAKEAIKYSKLDWQVGLQPVTVAGKVVDEYKAVVRGDNQKTLSILGNRYHPIQNSEAFDFFDAVIGEGQAVYDTAGSLHGGKKVWIMAKLKGQLFIDSRPDDTMDKNVLLCTSHDGSSSLSMQIVGTRVVCQNTLSIALSNATNQIKIRHTRNYQSKKDDAMKALKLCNAYFDDLQGVINALNSVEMTKSQMVSFAEKLIPNAKEEESTRTLNIRNDIVTLFDRGTGNLGKSRWDALNAVTEYVDHNRSTRTVEGGSADDNRFASVMFGSGARLKDKAFELLVA